MSDDRDYQSGPFCQHWSDPYDCEDACTCRHACSRHNGSEECEEPDCGCPKFVEAEDAGSDGS